MKTTIQPYDSNASDEATARGREAIAEKIEMMKSYLRGYGRSDKEALLALLKVPAYSLLARQVLASRRARLLDLFDDRTLCMIADGDISFAEVVGEVAEELERS